MDIVTHKSNYTFNIQTVQAGAFRVLVEALKDILTDCNFIIDSTGIKLIATDSSHNVLIHMKLHAENFEKIREIFSFVSLYSNNSFSLILGLKNTS